jgi:hypothetical protein
LKIDYDNVEINNIPQSSPLLRMIFLQKHIYGTRMIGGVKVNEILFLIVALLLLSLITGLRMLIHVWGKKYRYKSSWEMLYSDGESIRDRKRKKRLE